MRAFNLNKNMKTENKTVDIKDVIARKVNDKIDRSEKQTNLAYWANVNNIASSQIILQAQESLPEIYTIRKIYMIIVMGKMVMRLDDQVERIYSPGNVIDIPSRTKMKIRNVSSEKTAILVMKL